MPHADSAFVPESINTKTEFWAHVYEQLELLLEGQTSWVSNLANASGLLYHSLQAFPKYFGIEDSAVNWCGFYLDASRFPPLQPNLAGSALLVGPFVGKPACQYISLKNGGRGVCADCFVKGETILVSDVNRYPGHIACDGETQSEIVVPMIKDGVHIGVLDLDCLALDAFDDDDKVGLEKITQFLVGTCTWE